MKLWWILKTICLDFLFDLSQNSWDKFRDSANKFSTFKQCLSKVKLENLKIGLSQSAAEPWTDKELEYVATSISALNSLRELDIQVWIFQGYREPTWAEES